MKPRMIPTNIKAIIGKAEIRALDQIDSLAQSTTSVSYQ